MRAEVYLEVIIHFFCNNMYKKIVDYALTFVVTTWGQAVGEAVYEMGKVGWECVKVMNK